MHGAHNTCWNAHHTLRKKCVCARECALLLPSLLFRPNPSPDVVHSRNPSKSTLAHDAVAAAVSHKHHTIIRVGAGLIQFVHGSHSHLATEFTHHRNEFSPFFARVFFQPDLGLKLIWRCDDKFLPVPWKYDKFQQELKKSFSKKGSVTKKQERNLECDVCDDWLIDVAFITS